MEKPKQQILEFKSFTGPNPTTDKKKAGSISNIDAENNDASILKERDSESIDTSFLQKLMTNEDQFKETLVTINDQAAQQIQAGNYKSGLQMLNRLKKILEYTAENGKLLDRNMIIVCLYNIACAYQIGWVLDKCCEYIDAVVYNLNQSISQDETRISAISTDLNNPQVKVIIGIKISKQKFLIKVYLQYCAVLSQLSKHDEALNYVHKAQRVMISVLSQCACYCKDAKELIDREIDSQAQIDGHSIRLSSHTNSLNGNLDFFKNLEKSPTFYDEVPYFKHIIDFAVPFLHDLIGTVKKFSTSKVEDTLKQIRKLLLSWKTNSENTEKYLRKEFGKASFLKEDEDKGRSVLGLQSPNDWLQNLNIGSFMHMKPLKYKEYAERKELLGELTKESLQEKVILQSLIYFSTATEIRFLGTKEEAKALKDETKPLENQQMSEAYHLVAIEVVCKYISGSCPYVNHLIASYQKHYNKDLEPILEESFQSVSEDAASTKESNDRDYKLSILSITPRDYQRDSIQNVKKDKKPRPSELIISMDRDDPSFQRRASDNSFNQFIKDPSSLIQRVKSAEKQKDIDQATKLGLKKGKPKTTKNSDLRSRKTSKNVDEIKKPSDNSSSSSSFGISVLRGAHHYSGINASLSKTPTINSSRNELSSGEHHDSKYYVKKNFDIPSLGLTKVLNADHKTHIVSDRKDIKPKYQGFISDRSMQHAQRRDTEVSPNPDKSEKVGRKTGHNSIAGNNCCITGNQNSVGGNPNSGVNFYLYKNFNKFIQNLYVKNEDSLQPKLIKKKEEKTVDKDLTNIKKAPIKKTTDRTQPSLKSFLVSGRRDDSSELKQNEPVPRRDSSFGDSLKKVLSLSPKKTKKKFTEVLGDKKKPEVIERPTPKSATLQAIKTIKNSDFLKLNQNKTKIKTHSPRDY